MGSFTCVVGGDSNVYVVNHGACDERVQHAVRAAYTIVGYGKHHFAYVDCLHKVVLVDMRIALTSLVPQIIPIPHDMPVVQVACGAKNIYVLCKTGAIFSYGSNCCGQGGVGSVDDVQEMQEVVLLGNTGTRFSMLAAGNSHCLATSVDGHVYGWGRNSEGQLGILDKQSLFSPVWVNGGGIYGETIVFVAAAGCSSFFVTARGDTFACGANQQGQLGLASVTGCSSATRVPGLTSVYTVSCGDSKTFVLCQDGSIWCAGSEAHWQHTRDLYMADLRPIFQQLDTAHFTAKAVQIICGHDKTLIVTGDGHIYSSELVPRRHAHPPQKTLLLGPTKLDAFAATHARVGGFMGCSRAMLLAFAMATHQRLGTRSTVQTLDRVPELVSLILKQCRTHIFKNSTTDTTSLCRLFGQQESGHMSAQRSQSI